MVERAAETLCHINARKSITCTLTRQLCTPSWLHTAKQLELLGFEWRLIFGGRSVG